MAPLASSDRNATIDLPYDCAPARRNLTSAVNYEVPFRVTNQSHAFDKEAMQWVLASAHDTSSKEVQIPLSSISMNFDYNKSFSPDTAQSNIFHNGLTDFGITKKRRIEPERKNRHDAGRGRCRVRYDMQQVPSVRRNKQFLLQFPIWWLGVTENERRAKRLALPSNDVFQASASPFQEDISVVWVPTKRSEWEDSVQEMTAVCFSAAIRRYSTEHWSALSKPIQPPLSREYIKDRIDIDDPLDGFQIRCKNGGWLQGFILYTTFTTWTHGFKWDSRHAMSGIFRPSGPIDDLLLSKVDYEGTLTDELDRLPRSGDPQGTGIVFPNIAEISLVGGLGCGEYLLRMAIDSIRAKNQYRYVALQATEESKTFYEEFGFIRVGAICRYVRGLVPPEENTPFTGYRHWTHANESEKSLEMHGGPSYLMCLKLPEDVDKARGGTQPNFLASMMNLAVQVKPKVCDLGVGSASKRRPRKLTVSQDSASNVHYPPCEIGAGIRKSGRCRKRSVNENSAEFINCSNDSDKRSFLHSPTCDQQLSLRQTTDPNVLDAENTPRRRKLNCLSNIAVEHNDGIGRIDEPNIPRGVLAMQPQDRTRLSYIEKQYHSVWLAVPPKELPSSPRTPPKQRSRNVDNESPALTNSSSVESYAHRSGNKDAKLESPIAVRAGLRAVKSRFMKKSPESVNGITAGAWDRCEPLLVPFEFSNMHKPVNRATLMKQKVKSYPRSRLHYYNKVVKPNLGPLQYYFVLHFDEKTEAIRIVPMQARGLLTGKREGRPRYQALIGTTDVNFLTVHSKDYQVVNSAMVMKTPVVALEAWDIEDD